jgi:hypothetical protein
MVALPPFSLAPTARTRLLQVEYLLRAQDILLSLPADASRNQCLLALDAHRHVLAEQLFERPLHYSIHPKLKAAHIAQPATVLPTNLEDLF